MNTTTNTSKASELEEDDLEVKPRQARTADAPKAATASSSGDFSIADFEKLLEDDEIPF